MGRKTLLILAVAALGLVGLWVLIERSDLSSSDFVTPTKETSQDEAFQKRQVYTDNRYGFQVAVVSERPLQNVHCTMSSSHVYNAITTIPLTFKKTDCIWNQDPVGSYIVESDMLALVSIYDVTRCDTLPTNRGKSLITEAEVNFCEAVTNLPINTVQKVKGFGMVGGQQTTLVLKNEKYLIQFEGNDIDGTNLTGIQVIAIPTSQSTQTFQDRKRRFSFEYPAGYEVKVDVEKPTELNLSVRKFGDQEEAKTRDGVCVNCTFRLQWLPKFIGGSEEGDFKTPEDWVKFQKGIGANYSKTTMAGNTAYTLNEQEAGRVTYLIFIPNGEAFDRYDVSVKSSGSAGDTVLKTFSFTE